MFGKQNCFKYRVTAKRCMDVLFDGIAGFSFPFFLAVKHDFLQSREQVNSCGDVETCKKDLCTRSKSRCKFERSNFPSLSFSSTC